MFPIRDDNPAERPPLVTFALVAACAVAWVAVQGAGLSEPRLVDSFCTWGAIPAELLDGRGPWDPDSPCTPGGVRWPTLLTSMFLHGGWAHLIGNLWFLWIFGNNVEDALGHVRYLAFYLACGLVAAGAHVAAAPGSALPMVGASGAISGVMGAYLLFFPRARIHTLLFVLFYVTVADLPAFVYLGYWFLVQFVSAQLDPGTSGGVAFWAHVGGFVAGIVLAPILRLRR